MRYLFGENLNKMQIKKKLFVGWCVGRNANTNYTLVQICRFNLTSLLCGRCSLRYCLRIVGARDT